MTLQISGKQMDIGASLRTTIEDRIADVVDKHFGRPCDGGHITISREGHGFRADCVLHLPSGALLQATGEGKEAPLAFENALEKIEKRLRRYKRRLRSHNEAQKAQAIEHAMAYVIREADDDHAEDDGELATRADPAPIIIAETQSKVKTLSVSGAVMEMELADEMAMVFRNVKTGRLNVVHKRHDGNIAWIDPGKDD